MTDGGIVGAALLAGAPAAKCSDCHRAGSDLKEYSCTGCHEHSPDRIERRHREAGITNLDRCRRCHPSGDEDDTIEGEGKRGRTEGGKDDD